MDGGGGGGKKNKCAHACDYTKPENFLEEFDSMIVDMSYKAVSQRADVEGVES